MDFCWNRSHGLHVIEKCGWCKPLWGFSFLRENMKSRNTVCIPMEKIWALWGLCLPLESCSHPHPWSRKADCREVMAASLKLDAVFRIKVSINLEMVTRRWSTDSMRNWGCWQHVDAFLPTFIRNSCSIDVQKWFCWDRLNWNISSLQDRFRCRCWPWLDPTGSYWLNPMKDSCRKVAEKICQIWPPHGCEDKIE